MNQDRRRDTRRRKEVEEFLARTKNHAPKRRSIIASRREYVTVAEVIPVPGQDRSDVVVVRDLKDRLWEIRCHRDEPEDGQIRDCREIKVGMELALEIREIWMTTTETFCSTVTRPSSK